jgi:hypothetical protein
MTVFLRRTIQIVCLACPKAFVERGDLKKHIRRMHQEIDAEAAVRAGTDLKGDPITSRPPG